MDEEKTGISGKQDTGCCCGGGEADKDCGGDCACHDDDTNDCGCDNGE